MLQWAILGFVPFCDFLFGEFMKLNSVPCSKAFADALEGVGAEAELILYEGKTHTDLFLQVRDDWFYFFFFGSKS